MAFSVDHKTGSERQEQKKLKPGKKRKGLWGSCFALFVFLPIHQFRDLLIMNKATKQKRIRRPKTPKGQLQVCSFCGQKAAHEALRPQAFGQGEQLFVIELVPTIGCDNCGESYFSGGTIDELERIMGNQNDLAVKRPVPVAQFAPPTV